MRRDEALRILADHKQELGRDHHVQSLSIFGSVARDQAREDSDVDVLVEFDRAVGMFAFFRLQDRLEELFGRKVDLVTPAALHQAFRQRILSEAIRAA